VSELQILVMIAILGFGVALTRFLPFLVFKNTKKLPKAVEYLGKVLPAAMMGLLVVYCLKDCNFGEAGEVIPLVISVAAVAGVHLWKRKAVLSIAVGTVLYMVLIRVIPLIAV